MKNSMENILKTEMKDELLNGILPFWLQHAVDRENGGFYGKISDDLVVCHDAPKGGVLNARILWAYSAAYKMFGESDYKMMADRAYDYTIEFLTDKDYGGIYWLVDSRGNPLDTRKQVYAQAFAIYAFSEYYAATKETAALENAVALYELMEKHCYDHKYKGYFEACRQNWSPGGFYLDDKCGEEQKSMNTMLHVMEAYANLYRVWRDGGLRKKLKETVEVMEEYVCDDETGHFKLFFDEKWNSLTDEYSYGHDIEGSWLLTEACEVLEDGGLLEKIKPAALKMAEAVLSGGVDSDHGILYEGRAGGIIDSDRHSWPQAEAVVGFYNAYQLTGEEKFLTAALNTWEFIKKHIIDHRYGEWYWGRKQNGETINSDAKVDMWKCPYHNSRACMEILRRVIA